MAEVVKFPRDADPERAVAEMKGASTDAARVLISIMKDESAQAADRIEAIRCILYFAIEWEKD